MSSRTFDEDSTLFVYGSLIDRAHRKEIIGREVDAIRASLRDYERGRNIHFFVRRRTGTITQGLVLLNLSRREFDVLDRYEDAPRLYTREKITVYDDGGSTVRCWIYLPTELVLSGS
jgi:gamma-glutamylcyclotransferase (GGCT)/AIG2-like uncharacterized protein YtfP